MMIARTAGAAHQVLWQVSDVVACPNVAWSRRTQCPRHPDRAPTRTFPSGETSREVLLGLFHLTLTEAASHLGVGRTYFKKICRVPHAPPCLTSASAVDVSRPDLTLRQMRGIREWPNHQKLRRETAAPNSMDIHSLLENQSANMAGLRPIQDIRDNWLAPGPALLEKPYAPPTRANFIVCKSGAYQ